eukprot:3799503-Prymnesium_polylepis.1
MSGGGRILHCGCGGRGPCRLRTLGAATEGVAGRRCPKGCPLGGPARRHVRGDLLRLSTPVCDFLPPRDPRLSVVDYAPLTKLGEQPLQRPTQTGP